MELIGYGVLLVGISFLLNVLFRIGIYFYSQYVYAKSNKEEDYDEEEVADEEIEVDEYIDVWNEITDGAVLKDEDIKNCV